MNQEEAYYIFTHFSHLLPSKERLVFSHDPRGIESIDLDSWNKRVSLYFSSRVGKNDPEIAAFLSFHYEAFITLCAEKLLRDHPDKVFVNRCPKCHGMARTPLAKQCPHCFYNWH